MKLLKAVVGSFTMAIVSVSCAYVGLAAGAATAKWLMADPTDTEASFQKELNSVMSLAKASKELHLASPAYQAIRKNPKVAADMFRLTERSSLRTCLYSDVGGMIDRFARMLPPADVAEFNKQCNTHIEHLVDMATAA